MSVANIDKHNRVSLNRSYFAALNLTYNNMQTPEQTSVKSKRNATQPDEEELTVAAAPGVESLRNGGVKIVLHGQDGEEATVVCSGDILCMRSQYFREILHEWDGEQAIDEVL